eukprot:1418270-Prymnesium_polylepis.1
MPTTRTAIGTMATSADECSEAEAARPYRREKRRRGDRGAGAPRPRCSASAGAPWARCSPAAQRRATGRVARESGDDGPFIPLVPPPRASRILRMASGIGARSLFAALSGALRGAVPARRGARVRPHDPPANASGAPGRAEHSPMRGALFARRSGSRERAPPPIMALNPCAVGCERRSIVHPSDAALFVLHAG